MKNLLFIAVLFFVVTVDAQTGFGIQAGAIASTVDFSMDEEDRELYGNKKMLPGFKVGFFAEVPLTDNLYFNPELNYVYKGGKYDNHIENEFGKGDITTKITTSYLELPLNLMYKVNGEHGFYVGAGPVVGMGLSGNGKITARGSDSEGNSIDDTEKGKIIFDGKENADDDDSHLKRIEMGLNAFAGYELQNGLRFQIQYRPNFTNLSPEKEGSYRNSYFGLTIGYRF